MCRYRYGKSSCAHRLVEGRECVGEARCMVKSTPARYCVANSDCSIDEWRGLYCSKYQRFYCAGMDNCGTAEKYMAHFAEYRASLGRRV